MAPRQRKDPRLPDGLRERDGYFSYTSPLDGREYGIGRDRRVAIQQAMEANAALRRKPSVLERITGSVHTWSEWCDEFEKLLQRRESKPNTVRTRKSLMKRLRTVAPANKPANQVSTEDCSRAIDVLTGEGKQRMAQSFRSFMRDSFDRMVAKGWRADNPAKVTDVVTVKVKRGRLSFQTFTKLYETTSIVWLRNAMALAIVGGQDRDSCGHAEFTHIRNGAWFNERTKTGARIELPLELRLDCFGMSLEDVVSQCRRTGVVSRYLIHQTERAKGATIGKPLHLDVITRTFTAELAKLRIDWEGKSPPTFHEIRSLSGRLYKQQGDVNPQELFGHKDPRTTAVYTDGRGEWMRVSIKK
jgi:integrase